VSGLNSRLKRVEARIGEMTPSRDEILEHERDWVSLALTHALIARSHLQGRCVEERHHFAQFHKPDDDEKARECLERDAWLLEAYDNGVSEPGWKPRVIEPGFAGAPSPDPGKVDAALLAWLQRYGLPIKPRTWVGELVRIHDGQPPVPTVPWRGPLPPSRGRRRV
jgi:hypothetical protein